MDKNSLSEITCPKCSANIVIYKGWADFEDQKIKILKGAKWRCPSCGETGKLDGEPLVE